MGWPLGPGDRTENSACPLLLAPSEAALFLFLLFYLIPSSNSWEEVTKLWRLEVESVAWDTRWQEEDWLMKASKEFSGRGEEGAGPNPTVLCALSSPAMPGLLLLQFESHTSLRVHPQNCSSRKSTR